MRVKFLMQIIKTMLRCKGYEWYSPYVRRVMEEDNEYPDKYNREPDPRFH